MCPVVKVSSDVYERLEAHATGFDTPENVIERLLDQIEGVKAKPRQVISPKTIGERDFTQYLFQGKSYRKARLVQAVVSVYVDQHSPITYVELLEVFPKQLQGSLGVFDTLENAQKIVDRSSHKRHYIESNERIELADCIIAVSTQWGIGNINNFIDAACDLGLEISPAS